MKLKVIKDMLGWGFLLWLIGYGLGILLYTLVPLALIGWVIMPVGIIITVWVLIKKIKSKSFNYYLLLGIVWAVIAIVCDYFFLVKAFKPADGYYKLDVYLYYFFIFILPVIVGYRKSKVLKK